MGWLSRWDRRNQRILEAHNEQNEVVARGGVAVSSLPALLKVGAITLVVVVALVVQGSLWGYGAAVAMALTGGAMVVSLARDVKADATAWRDRRRGRRSIR